MLLELSRERTPLIGRIKVRDLTIKEYHTDNGTFNVLDFMKGIFKTQKKIRFSGAGASHKDGVT